MTGNEANPDEAVEAAAKGLAANAWGDWEYVPDELRRLFLRDAKVALEAAAPHLMAQAWEEGWDAGAGWPQADINPYRTGK